MFVLVGYTEEDLSQLGKNGKRRRHIEDARARLRYRTYIKDGELFWETGKPVHPASFADAWCTPKAMGGPRPVKRRGLLVRLSEAQNHRCCFCGIQTTYVKCHDHTATIEHLTPVVLGGRDTYENCVMSCYSCNNKRGTMDAMEFFENRGWLPELEVALKLRSKMRAFVRLGDVRILGAMNCCKSGQQS